MGAVLEKADSDNYMTKYDNSIHSREHISEMTKTFSILLCLVFVAAAQHLDSATDREEKVGQ